MPVDVTRVRFVLFHHANGVDQFTIAGVTVPCDLRHTKNGPRVTDWVVVTERSVLGAFASF